MSERDTRPSEVRLTPPPRIAAVGSKRDPGARRDAGAPGPVATARPKGRPRWALPLAFALLAAVGLSAYLLIAAVGGSDGAGAQAGASPARSEPAAGGQPSPDHRASPSFEPVEGASKPGPDAPASSPNAGRGPSPTAAGSAGGTETAALESRESAGGSGSAEFGAALAAALGAIESDDWPAAKTALERAELARPGAPEVAEARARLAAGEAEEVIEAHLGRADEAFSAERWREAAREFGAALALEPTLTRAKDGVALAEERAQMAELIDYHLANPDRLAAAEVLAEAETLFEDAARVESPGARHQRQTAALGDLLAGARQPVRVSLRSDDLTEVLVYKVGRLGTFSSRQLELRPGLYTIVGTRKGYRDVRHQLRVRPGETPEPLLIRCEEKI